MSPEHGPFQHPLDQSQQIRDLVHEFLKRRVRSLSVSITEFGIVLNGYCDSYHTKQMAQEIVSQHTTLRVHANNLTVQYSGRPTSQEDHLATNVLTPATNSPPKETTMSTTNQLSRIFYPSDFSSDSEVAFFHAIKLALQSKASLQMMHVDTEDQAEWEDFPDVQKTLQRWKVIPEGSGQQAIDEVGLDISKIIATSPDPVKACLEYLDVNEADLIVLSVHQREGLMRWLGNMTGEKISFGAKQTTLFLPAGRPGFINPETGDVHLKSILIPVVKKPRSDTSIEFVKRLIKSLDLVAGSVTLLHVGTSETMPFVKHPIGNAWTWSRLRLEGDATETIVHFAKVVEADLIVMTTDGPDRFLDGLRGTTSERVLRRAHCPVACIPVESVIE